MEGPFARLSAEEMDEARSKQVAYQYLCHLQEAKLWLEKVLKRKIPSAAVLEENLRNGVLLARLGHYVTPEVVPLGSIYDPDQKRYETAGLNFRHTDNINLWIRALQRSGFPRIFLPEVPDVFDRKNMPKVIYCIHALSAHLFRLGQAPPMQDLYGKIEFEDDLLVSVSKELKRSGVAMPAFQKISSLFSKEIDAEGNLMESAISAVNDAIDKMSCQNLLVALSEPALKLKCFRKENLEMYLEVFSSAKREKCESSLNKSLNGSCEVDTDDDILLQPEIQGHIHSVNLIRFWQQLSECVEGNNNDCLDKLIRLNENELGEGFESSNVTYYITALKNINLNNIDLSGVRQAINEIVQTGNKLADIDLKVRRSLASIRKIVETDSSEDLFKELNVPHLKVAEHLLPFASTLYFYELREHFNMTMNLTLSDIEACIHSVNVVAAVTRAVDNCDADMVWQTLLQLNKYFNSALDLPEVADSSLRQSYFDHLESVRNSKLDAEVDLLTLEDIQDCIDDVNALQMENLKKLTLMEDLNLAVRCQDKDKLSFLLPCIVTDFDDSNMLLWMHLLKKKYDKKQRVGQELWESDILSVEKEILSLMDELQRRILFLTEIKETVKSNDVLRLERCLLQNNWNADKPSMVLQVLREKFQENGSSWVQEVVNGKALWISLNNPSSIALSPVADVGVSTDDIKRVIEEINTSNILPNEVICKLIKIQALVRGFLVRKHLAVWRAAAVQIQRWWRTKLSAEKSKKARICSMQANTTDQSPQKRKATSEISPAPSCKNLNESLQCGDVVEELIQKLRHEVMGTIKNNQDLSKKVSEMDLKIGLLVRNRISVAALVAENKNKKVETVRKTRGIKSLSKESKNLLDNYQKLFYLLQTKPEYLSRLITLSPSNLTIVERCVLNLFNMGSSTRDAYLLLRLFATALNDEVKRKFHKPTDAVIGNPLVLKMAVRISRQTGGHHPLQYILSPLITRVLEQSAILDTNPVDIYNRWVNESEAISGCVSTLPRNVTQEIALTYPEVVQRLQNNIDMLKMWVKEFLNRLSDNITKFPYSLKFIAKTLQKALIEKFSDVTEKETLKIVGHLIYYQYVNSAIVAPDAFQIISLPAQTPLRAEQRKNLASIAKILQFSASKSGFGDESRHLMQLNPFIIECHEVMKQMSRECCSVPEPEDMYHVSEYSEALLVRRPRIYMTVAELCECHQLLIQQKDIIAPDPSDDIHDILHDIREVPTPSSILGCTPEVAANMSAEKNLICLELNTDFVVAASDKQACDLSEQKIRREAQNKELKTLQRTLSQLKEKSKHFEEQIMFYEKYLETCLGNITTKKKKSSRSLKYTGAQLLEKGVLANLDSVPTNQIKNVQFIISSTDVSGKFQVQCRFMGVEVETTHIDIQHLLSLQFEGCGVMNMFGKAEVNVNLLIHLLNTKFIKRNVISKK